MLLTEYNEAETMRIVAVDSARQEKERVATDMLRENYPLSAIEKISKLSENAIRQIAKKIGVAVL